MRDRVEQSLQAVRRWVEEHDYRGYEPFDGLSSFLRPLTLGNLFLDRLLMQAVRQSPLNLRPLLGIKPLDSTIGRGYMAWGYMILYRATGTEEYAQKARLCLDWLVDNKAPGHREYSWGKHFDFASRGGRYPRFEPITVWTALIAMAFLEAYEALGNARDLEVAQSVCRWILSRGRSTMDTGICISYTASALMGSTIHNHNILAAAVLARTWKHARVEEYLSVARQIMDYCCSCQLPSGAWYYGEEPMFHWIDNFHTGYNLDGLKCYMDCSGDRRYQQNMERGLQFYIDHFFEETGRPRYYHDRTQPVDSQCIAQSIDTLSNFADVDERSLPLALKVAAWAIENMQDERSGHFYYRQYPMIKAKTPMLHWAQATTFKALALLRARAHPAVGHANRLAHNDSH